LKPAQKEDVSGEEERVAIHAKRVVLISSLRASSVSTLPAINLRFHPPIDFLYIMLTVIFQMGSATHAHQAIDQLSAVDAARANHIPEAYETTQQKEPPSAQALSITPIQTQEYPEDEEAMLNTHKPGSSRNPLARGEEMAVFRCAELSG
jgi:hypothetical protein